MEPALVASLLKFESHPVLASKKKDESSGCDLKYKNQRLF